MAVFARRVAVGAVVLLLGVPVFAVASGTGAGASAPNTRSGADPNGVWHKPQKLAVSQNSGNFAQTTAVSCSSPGNCGAVGSYDSAETNHQIFVANEVDGTWGRAKTVHIIPFDYYTFTAISCPSNGNCAAVGENQSVSAFVLDETNGTWGRPRPIGTGALEAVSCPQAGDCVAGGTLGYGGQAFVATETAGKWGKPHAIPGSDDVDAAITSISCPSIGNCAAGGSYDQQPYGPLPGVGYPFVVNETGGTWGSATPLKGPFDYKDSNYAVDTVTSVSCSSPGNCGAGGYYGQFQGFRHGFVVSETGGTWGTAQEVAGSLDAGNGGWLQSVSCPTNGNCSGAGAYVDSHGDFQTFAVDDVSGTWQPAQQVGASVNPDGYAWMFSISCASAGNCSAAGYAANAADGLVGMVVTETNGHWGAGQAVAKSPIADAEAEINSISCPAVGSCTAGGVIDDVNDHQQAFVSDETPIIPSTSRGAA